MKRTRREPSRIADILGKAYPAPEQLAHVRVFSWWSRSMPERILRNARPVSLHNGVLVVHVSSSAWANELHYVTQDLLIQVQKAAPEARVRKLHFRVGDLPPLRKRSVTPRETPSAKLGELPEELGRALARVHDDDLRDAIARAASGSTVDDELT